MGFNFAAVALLLAIVMIGERLVEALQPLVKPVLLWLERVLKVEPGWPGMVFAWLILSALAGLAGINVFGEAVPELMGRVLTALLAGGGANLLHDLWPGGQNGQMKKTVAPIKK